MADCLGENTDIHVKLLLNLPKLVDYQFNKP